MTTSGRCRRSSRRTTWPARPTTSSPWSRGTWPSFRRCWPGWPRAAASGWSPTCGWPRSSRPRGSPWPPPARPGPGRLAAAAARAAEPARRNKEQWIDGAGAGPASAAVQAVLALGVHGLGEVEGGERGGPVARAVAGAEVTVVQFDLDQPPGQDLGGGEPHGVQDPDLVPPGVAG